jgi:hypothetical protein
MKSDPVRRKDITTARLVFAFLTLVCLVAWPEPSDSLPSASLPFAVGERLTYNLRWGVVAVGTVVLEVTAREPIEQEATLKITHRARSGPVLSKIYPVDDFMESHVSEHTLLPSRHWFRRREGSHKNDLEIIFNQAAGRVTDIKDGRSETHDIPGGTQDAVSWLYVLRTFDGARQSSVSIPIHHDGTTYQLQVQYQGIERLKMRGRDYDTLHFRAMMPPKGLFSNRGSIEIWLSNDQARVPVLVKTTIAVGTLTAILAERDLRRS